MNFHHLYSKENLLGKLSKPIENQISKNNRRKFAKYFMIVILICKTLYFFQRESFFLFKFRSIVIFISLLICKST